MLASTSSSKSASLPSNSPPSNRSSHKRLANVVVEGVSALSFHDRLRLRAETALHCALCHSLLIDRSEQPVAGIAQPRANKFVPVELTIETRDMQVHVWMLLKH